MVWAIHPAPEDRSPCRCALNLRLSESSPTRVERIKYGHILMGRVDREAGGRRDRRLKVEIQRAHARIARTYGGYSRVAYPISDTLRDLVKEALQRHCIDPERHRLLELGCGNGAFLAMFRGMGFKSITGLDIAAPMLGAARDRLGGDVLFVQGDAENLPLKDGSFDVAYLYGVIQHLEAPKRCLAETLRVLAPGGIALVDLPHRLSASYFSHLLMGIPATQWGSKRSWLGWINPRAKFRSYRFFSLKELSLLMEGLPGFVAEAIPTRYLALHGPLDRIYEETLARFRLRHGDHLEAVAKRLFKVPSGYMVVLRLQSI